MSEQEIKTRWWIYQGDDGLPVFYCERGHPGGMDYIDTDDDNENKALKKITQTIRDTSIASGIPTIVAAHLRKMGAGGFKTLVPDTDDFHGTSEITKNATRVITIAPARDQVSTKPWLAPTYIAALKDRRSGGVDDWVALAEFDLRTFSYEETYRLGRLNFLGDKWEETGGDKVPNWAHEASNVGSMEGDPFE